MADRSAGLGRVLVVVSVVGFGFGWTASQIELDYAASVTHAALPSTVNHFGLAVLLRWDVLFGVPLIYLVATMLLSRLFAAYPSLRVKKASAKRKEPMGLYNAVQIAYNVTQIAVCSWMVWGLAPVLTAGTVPWFGLGLPYSASIEKFVFVHYLTKMLDWFDTLFQLVEGKEVSFLHVFHHATIGIVWGYLLSIGHGNGTCAYGAWINSVTHVIMYTHYLVTALGFTNPLKAQVTQFQLAQFASCILHAVLVLTAVVEPGCPSVFGFLQISYHFTMIMLFGWNMRWYPRWLTGFAEEDEKKAQRAATMLKRLQ